MSVRMRSCAVIFSIALSGCVCSPATPQSVTLRLKNTSTNALYVDQRDGRLRLVVPRNVGAQNLSFVETPTCACQACDMVCSGTCDCPMPAPLVQRIAAAEIK